MRLRLETGARDLTLHKHQWWHISLFLQPRAGQVLSQCPACPLLSLDPLSWDVGTLHQCRLSPSHACVSPRDVDPDLCSITQW